jgi:hypothetical protein
MKIANWSTHGVKRGAAAQGESSGEERFLTRSHEPCIRQ